ncbi:MAG: TonB-dependent siderophore receptor [Bradyrhizobium sp.]|uniref:TonB-dependent siderophore receptor n=1 Tax=Bradyrhizobium sp. TaxID=376 RepID=UPI001DDED0C4|nr:TonB-dependent siderophore receptor [Bradyrhizobium sp.]MBV9566280.1 TonB-dependent siderophore receptor [Bradyrhizobium sp.]
MSRFMPALCAAASVAAMPIAAFAQAVSQTLPASPSVLAAADDGQVGNQTQLPPVEVNPPAPRKPRPARETRRPVQAPARAAAAPPIRENRPATELGSSQTGAGLGGRFTGYTADFGAPVAATKDNTPLLQAPVNVQVVPRQVMDDHQDISVRDAVVGYVSSVQPPSITPSSSNFYDGFNVRGFDNTNIYRNDLRLFEITGIETANLQSIEVLKGPAAMLFGRLEPGGIINLVPKRPLDVPYASIQEQFGSWGLSRTTIDSTGPLTQDKTWLYRVNLDYTKAGSFTDFVNSNNFFVAPTITWHPTNQFRFNVDVEYQKSSFVDNSMGIPAVGTRPADIPVSRYLQAPALTANNPNRQERELIGYDWTYDINNDWSITNRFAFNNQDYRQFLNTALSFDEATGDLARQVWDAQVHTQTVASNLDIKGRFNLGPFSNAVLFGTDYFNLDKNIEAFFGTNPSIGPINIFAPTYNEVYTPLPANNFLPLREQWTGVYGQDVVSFAQDRIHLLFGGRYDWASYGTGFSPNSDAEALGPYDPATGIGFLQAHDQAFSPRFGASVQPLPWLSFYGNYTKSFGVTNALPVPGQPLFPPEEATQKEVGIKAELLDKRLTATLALYDIVKNNVVSALGGTPFSTPVGQVESKGVELDVTGRINDHWSIIASYAYDDARIVKGQGPSVQDIVNGTLFPPANVVDESGNRLQDVPYNSGAIWAKYDADGRWRGLSLGAGVVAVGDRQGDNENSFILPAYARVDAMIQYQFKPPPETMFRRVTLQLNVKNVFDTVYYQNSSSRLDVFPGVPRTFLASIRGEL